MHEGPGYGTRSKNIFLDLPMTFPMQFSGKIWLSFPGTKYLILLVGAAGFEPTTCSTQNCRATRLRYTPIVWETTSIHA
jgi:hypothetical protein